MLIQSLFRNHFVTREIGRRTFSSSIQLLAPTFQCTKLEAQLPVPFKSVHATYVPPAQTIFAFWNGKLSRFLVNSNQWCPVEGVKGLPGVVVPTVTQDNSLYVVGQTGMTMGEISLFSIKPEKPNPNEIIYTATQQDPPPKFQKSVLCSVGTSLVMFGETYLDEINEAPARVACFSSPEKKWLAQEPQGTPPRLSNRLSAVGLDERRALVFMPSEDELSYELYEFDTFSFTWTEVSQKKAPGAPHPLPLRTASVARLGRYVLITGGMRMVRYTNHVAIFDTQTSTWLNPKDHFVGDFSSRGGHATVPISDSSLIMFGGTADGLAPKDMYRIDLSE